MPHAARLVGRLDARGTLAPLAVSCGSLVLVEAFRRDSSTGIRKVNAEQADTQPELPPQR